MGARVAYAHLADWLRERSATGSLSRTSVNHYRKVGLIWIAWAPDDPRKWRHRHVVHWVEQYNADATKRAYLKVVRGFCRWMLQRGLIDRDPTESVASPRVRRKVSRAFSVDETDRLVAACPDTRSRAIVLLALQAALRRSELSAVDLGDIDPSRRELLVHGKGGAERVVPIPEEAMEAIERYLDDHPTTAGPLFRSFTTDQRLQPETISRLVDTALRAASVKRRSWDGRTLHACRHTAASDVLDRTGSLPVVQELLGHASVATTEIYTRSRPSHELREAVEGRRYGR